MNHFSVVEDVLQAIPVKLRERSFLSCSSSSDVLYEKGTALQMSVKTLSLTAIPLLVCSLFVSTVFASDGIEVISKDDFTLTFGGILQADLRYSDFSGDASPGLDPFDLRRVRLKTSALIENKYFLRIEYELQGNEMQNLIDGYVNIDISRDFDLRIGQFLTPFSLQGMGKYESLPFAERSMGWDISPRRDVGFMGHGNIHQDKAFWLKYNDVLSSTGTYDIDIQSHYLAFLWMATGEQPTLGKGLFEKITPARKHAFGVSLRFDHFDGGDNAYDEIINEGDSVKEADAITLGLNWYTGSNNRIIMDITRTAFDTPLLVDRDSVASTALYSDRELATTLRYQVSF